MKVNPIPPASPPDRAPAPAGSTRGSEFALNGRFYGQRVTGVQRYAREIARALDADRRMSGLALRVLTPAGSAIDPELGGVEWRGVGPLRGHAWEQLTLPARCRGPLLNLCNTAPAVKTDQVVCIHDANIFLQPESYSLAFRTLYRSLLPAVGRRSARVTTVSSFSASQIDEHLGIERRKIEVVPNGHEHVFRWSAASSRVGERLRPGRPFVLLLGSNARHKNAGLILGQAEALDALGLDLVVVGGSDKIFASVTGVSRSNILRLGAVSDDDLAYLYAEALCLAFPSLTEGFGLPVLEAMASGCPVVSSDRSSMPEVCGDAALMASPDDPGAWRRHFAALAASRSLRGELREAGRVRCGRFSWAGSARHYAQLMGDVR